MRKLFLILLITNAFIAQSQLKPFNINKSIENGYIKAVEDYYIITSNNSQLPVKFNFPNSQCVGITREGGQWYVLPINDANCKINVNTSLWIIPKDPFSSNNSWFIKLQNTDSIVATAENVLNVKVYARKFEMHKSEARPHSDCFNNRYTISIKGGETLTNALASFYWGTMLPLVIEKTKAKEYPYSNGYVMSTLNANAYAGSYPDVDHEFQIKGRLAMASDLDIDVVRRMIELQFKLMRDDPEGLFRNPCSVQPNGFREYDIRRNSQNYNDNADMFLLTSNMEVLEESWKYFEVTKDINWLIKNIVNLENAASLTIANTDQYGRVWSDVFYEDQVIKDGRETMSSTMAAYTFQILANIESVLKHEEKSIYYSGFSKKIAAMLVKPLHQGYWDEKNQHFVDWVDRKGGIHDHLHLLANILPVLFGYTSTQQTKAIFKLVDSNLVSFQRFPSFVSADIAGYKSYEIGDGGPYDLCAAGRYWYWDASFWEWRNNKDMLYNQLKTVAIQAAKDSFYMGERYDMDHVYYIDGKSWHGTEKYYEYPCVYTSVLISKFLGIKNDKDADLCVNPHINSYGDVEFNIPNYDIKYTYNEKGFILKNLSGKTRNFKVDLSALYSDKAKFKFVMKSKSDVVGANTIVELSVQEEAKWILLR